MSQSQILIHEVSYHLTSGSPLFNLLTLTFPERKIGLVGQSGVGKSHQWYLGSKESFQWLKNNDLLTFEPFSKALIPDATIESIQLLIDRVVSIGQKNSLNYHSRFILPD